MQTFLPYASYEKTASILDFKRLGKQRVETLQIMGTLVRGGTKGWVNHPAVDMWRGYEYSLLEYQFAICYEWHVVRGFKDTCLMKTAEIFWSAPYLREDAVPPWWLGRKDFHLSHQSNLLGKDPEHYSDMFEGEDVPLGLEYVWPTREKNSH